MRKDSCTSSMRVIAPVLSMLGAAVLVACGGGSGDADVTFDPNALVVQMTTTCAPGDNPEPALQGQVPAALRQTGFKGFNCNLQLVGRYEGEGGSWSSATVTDNAGRTCTYQATAAPLGRNGVPTGRTQSGVPVVDITNPSAPVRTTSLTTVAMLGPWESLRANAARKLLVADDVRERLADLKRMEGVLVELVDRCGVTRGTVRCPLIVSLQAD